VRAPLHAPGEEQRHLDLPDRPRHQGRRHRRPEGLEHMVDTVLYSRASATTPTACCGAPRTASARPTRWACSRCAARAWSR
jgi:hypothetical protein